MNVTIVKRGIIGDNKMSSMDVTQVGVSVKMVKEADVHSVNV